MFMNVNEIIRNMRNIAKNGGVYLQDYLYLSCSGTNTTKFGTKLRQRHAIVVNGPISNLSNLHIHEY